MAGQGIEEAIRIIHGRLKNSGIKWALAGSANMRIQGMQVEPRDLDIVIQREDLDKISRIFSDCSATHAKQFKTRSGEPAWEVKAKINGVEIQFFGGDGDDIYVSKLLSGRIITVNLGGIGIPCFTLEAESQAYMETNRNHKSLLIQEFLSAQRGN